MQCDEMTYWLTLTGRDWLIDWLWLTIGWLSDCDWPTDSLADWDWQIDRLELRDYYWLTVADCDQLPETACDLL